VKNNIQKNSEKSLKVGLFRLQRGKFDGESRKKIVSAGRLELILTQ
jgi:hypothetical protein